jgi:hypothetical protein
MNLRPATSADLALLQHWDSQPHVIASNPNDKWGIAHTSKIGHDVKKYCSY